MSTGSDSQRSGTGVWMIGTNGTAHLYPDAKVPGPGHHSACHGWISTTLDAVEGPVEEWCTGCEWQRKNGLV